MTGITIQTGIFQGNLRKFRQMLKKYLRPSLSADCLRLAPHVLNCPLLQGHGWVYRGYLGVLHVLLQVDVS